MKSQVTETTQADGEISQAMPEVLPLELLSLVAGGLPFNVGASVPTGEGSETSALPFNVGG